MSDILLDYAFQVNVNIPIPSADISYIRTPLVVCKPKSGATAGYYTVSTEAEIEAQTDNVACKNLLGVSGGKISSFKLLTTETLDIEDTINAHLNDFFSLLISDDFTKENIDADLTVGQFVGVKAFSIEPDPTPATDTANIEWLTTWAITSCGFYGTAKNMFEAFGLLFGATTWKNKQYATMPDAGITETEGLGKAENLFNDRISFVITSAQYGNKLAFFATAKQAIVAPFVTEEIKTLLQSEALTWINQNEPNYTITQATLLQENEEKVFENYIENGIIESGTVKITLESDNFVATGTIRISEPKALWRVKNELYQI